MRVHAACPGLLVLSDTFYPGWEARVNRHAAAIHPTDGLFRGVAVPAGTSTVTVRYRPESFRLGVLLALAGLGVFGAVSVVVLGRRRRGPDGSDREHVGARGCRRAGAGRRASGARRPGARTILACRQSMTEGRR